MFRCRSFLLQNFNPRTHVGCDSLVRRYSAPFKHFNPRTHVGCDEVRVCKVFYLEQFQSTHPRGVRRLKISDLRSVYDFNPRTHVGCDDIVHYVTVLMIIISIHAPTWGATRDFAGMFDWTAISIHAPTWGATRRQDNRSR